MIDWRIERVVNFDFASGDLCKDGFVHFGFHDRDGKQYVVEHRKHFFALVGRSGRLEWTVANRTVFEGVPNIQAELSYPMYVDSMSDGTLVCSNFGNNSLYRIDVSKKNATLFVDGSALGMKKAGNCVVDDDGCVWVNEVEGCRVWRFDSTGKPVLTLGDGKPGFQPNVVDFDEVRFNWIYDIRRGPDGNICVLDSKNFAVRMIDLGSCRVYTLAGTGKGGYDGDGGNARNATFGSNPEERFDGPISLSLDEEGNIYVGDRQNHVVRMIHRKNGVIRTIAGNNRSIKGQKNNPNETNPFMLNLPEISSMDYDRGRLLVPTDIKTNVGDLIVLKRS